jgi:hypothetical protein
MGSNGGLVHVDNISSNGAGADPWYFVSASLSGTNNVVAYRQRNQLHGWWLLYRTNPSVPSVIYTLPQTTFGIAVGVAVILTAAVSIVGFRTCKKLRFRPRRRGSDTTHPVRMTHHAAHPSGNTEESILLLGVEIEIQPGRRARHHFAAARPGGHVLSASV